MAKALSYQEAADQATILRKQGLPFPKIAEHLAKIGYVSPKTKTAVGEQSVRNMILKELAPPSGTANDAAPIKVRTPNLEVLEALRKIPTLGLSPQLTLKLVNTLLESL